MPPPNIKKAAHHLVEQLPDNATWDDLMYEIYVRQAIETGTIVSETRRIADVDKSRAQLGLTP